MTWKYLHQHLHNNTVRQQLGEMAKCGGVVPPCAACCIGVPQDTGMWSLSTTLLLVTNVTSTQGRQPQPGAVATATCRAANARHDTWSNTDTPHCAEPQCRRRPTQH